MKFLLPLVLLSALLASAHGEAWLRFRGDNGSGVAASPKLALPLSEKSIAWKAPLAGKGHSSPVVVNGKLFVTYTPLNTAQRVLVALDSASGKQLWQREWETPTFRQHADNSFTSASPAVDAERVFIWWSSPEQSWLAALSQKDGKELWKKELGSFSSQHGAGSSPIVFEDSVILDFSQENSDGAGSYLLCADAKTGATRWKLDRKNTNTTSSTPCLYRRGNEPAQLIVIGRSTGMTSIDPRTGQVNWELTDLLPKRCVASPVITSDGLIIAQCGEGQAESFVYAVRPGSAGTKPEKVYNVVRTGGYVPTPIALGPHLFLWKENGLVTCIKAATNEQVWSERVEGPFYGSPICVDGKLINVTRRGDLVVLNAGDKFELLGRFPLGEGSFATPAVADGKIFVRTFTQVMALKGE